jgi:hypothetical protein
MINLRAAAESGGEIEPSDKQRWKAYIRQYDVKEASCMSYARARSDDVSAAIINDGGPWDGYYVYSRDEEFCLKFEPATRDEPAPAGGEAPTAPAGEAPRETSGEAPAEGADEAPGEQAGGETGEQTGSEPPTPSV